MKQVGFSQAVCIIIFFVFCGAAIASAGKIRFTSLASFDGPNGNEPFYISLIQGTDGAFYGTTRYGGASNRGTIFRITAEGTLTTLYSFGGSDGEYPIASLLQGVDGDLYGTTDLGGANGHGTVFKITLAGKLTMLYNFCSRTNCADGATPFAGLVQTADGTFYGTTAEGGANNVGTVFRITSGGALTTLHNFDGSGGSYPYAQLVQSSNGSFYGTTFQGGANNDGTVFKITAGGRLTSLHSFDGTDGEEPVEALVQATDGDFYGTTKGGGAHYLGTVFKITSGGTLTTLYTFDGDGNGEFPYDGLVQATDGDLYGTTGGAARGDGSIFKITTAGKLTTLYAFDGKDGDAPLGGLLQATNGTFYGTTNGGGADGDGTVFSVAVGLGPFVETLPSSGKVGTAVIILGDNLTGASGVTFHGTPANFQVVSNSEITTKVPNGATSGKVKVKLPSGTLLSNVIFRVR